VPSVNKETNNFWQEHVDKFSTFSGSAAEYCRENGLLSNFRDLYQAIS
jgi:hypothetical protein